MYMNHVHDSHFETILLPVPSMGRTTPEGGVCHLTLTDRLQRRHQPQRH